MVRRVPDRFDPAQLYRSVESNSASSSQSSGDLSAGQTADRFSVKLPISEFKRLLQLVGDYRLSADEIESASKSGDAGRIRTGCNGSIAEENTEDLAGEAKLGPDETGFVANFALGKFADSSFVPESDPGSIPGAAKKGGGASFGKERAANLSNASSGVRGDAKERAAATPIILASGEFSAVLDLQCQRCLGTYRHSIEAGFKLAFAANEVTADVLPETMDPVMLDEDGMITLVGMFEDELLLQLPTHAMHPDEAQCSAAAVPYHRHMVTDEELKPESPFSALKGLDFSEGEKSDE